MAESSDESQSDAPGPGRGARAWAGLVAVVDAFWSVPARFIEQVGSHVMLLGRVLFWSARKPLRLRVFLDQLEFIGSDSLVIVGLVSLFVGMVFALQLISALRQFQAESFVGSTVALALTRELAPVFTAIMLAARAGSGMATELGSMRITEQIDALTALAVSPVQFLVLPRVAAATVMAPMLTMVFNFVGMIGAYLVGVGFQGVDHGVFIENTRQLLAVNDLMQGVSKACIFGAALSLISCHQGFYAGGGAKGVGQATTRAVVSSFVTILVMDYFLTDIWLVVFPKA